MLQVWAPPTDSPVWNLPLELAAGKDSFGTPIVPEGKKAGLKSEQKRDDTKGLAVEFTDFLRERTKGKDGTSWIDWSPAMFDHIGKGLGTSWWRELPTEKGQAPIEGVGSETTMARRFVKAPWKGAQSTKEFFDLAGEGGKWSDLASSANMMLLAGKSDEVAKLLESASPERRAYALASIFNTGAAKQVHPLIRAEESVKVYRELAKDLRSGDVLAPHKDGSTTAVRLTPHQRRVAVDELSKLAVAEQRNALIMTGVKGWTGTKSAIPTEPIRRKIFQIAPELTDVMAYRARGVVPEAVGFSAWQGNRGAYEAPLNQAWFARKAKEKIGTGSGAADRCADADRRKDPVRDARHPAKAGARSGHCGCLSATGNPGCASARTSDGSAQGDRAGQDAAKARRQSPWQKSASGRSDARAVRSGENPDRGRSRSPLR